MRSLKSDGMLTPLRGSLYRTARCVVKGKDYVLSERRWGSFQRSFRVPTSIDEEKIEATFSNGVLTIVLPKSAETQQAEKTIDIKRV